LIDRFISDDSKNTAIALATASIFEEVGGKKIIREYIKLMVST